MVRIIGGKWKKKSLNVIYKKRVRPTPSRIRETLFNWLAFRIDLRDSEVLDLFAGSGALGIEAASRGANHVNMIESNSRNAREISFFLSNLENTDNIELDCEDALLWLEKNKKKTFDLIFLDPPYDSKLIELTLPILKERLNNNGLIYVEYNREIKNLILSMSYHIVCSGATKTLSYYLISKN